MAGSHRRPQQVSSRGLVPRLSIGSLQLSIRCSSIHFLPKRSFPVSTLEIRLVSGPLAVCDCSCAMAGDSAAITSEAVTPSTCLREEGRMGALPCWRLIAQGGSRNCGEHSVSCCRHQGKPLCLISCSHANSFDAKHIELAFGVAEGGPGHLSSRNPWTERDPLPKA